MVVLVILGVVALGAGVPFALHLRERRAAAATERSRAAAEAFEAERQRAETAAATSLASAAKEHEAADAAFRAAPVSHLIPPLRAALEKDVHPLQDQIEAAGRAGRVGSRVLAALEAKLAALEDGMPTWLRSQHGELIVMGLFALAPVGGLVVAALDYTMFKGVYDDVWQAALYTVVTMVITTVVGVAAIALVPRLLDLPEAPTDRLRARLQGGLALAGLVAVVGVLLLLAPSRSAATNEAAVVQAQDAYADVLADKEGERTYSEETLALRKHELQAAEDKQVRDVTVDQVLSLGGLGLEIVLAEAGLLAVGKVRPRRVLKGELDSVRHELDRLGEAEAQLGEAKTAAARRVATSAWNHLQRLGVAQPEVVIRDAMSRIASADPVHYQVVQQGVQRYRELADPTPGAVVAGEVVEMTGEPTADEEVEQVEVEGQAEPTTSVRIGDVVIGEPVRPTEADDEEEVSDPMADVPNLTDLIAL